MIRVVRVAVAEVVLIFVVKTKACQANTDLVSRRPSACRRISLASASSGLPAGMALQIHMCTSLKLPLGPRSLSCVACPKLSRIGLLDEV